MVELEEIKSQDISPKKVTIMARKMAKRNKMRKSSHITGVVLYIDFSCLRFQLLKQIFTRFQFA